MFDEIFGNFNGGPNMGEKYGRIVSCTMRNQ